MKSTNQNQRHGNVNKSVITDMRREILQLREELEEFNRDLSGHLELVNSIRQELDTAGHSAECLLPDDRPRTRTAGQPASARRCEAQLVARGSQ
jgi:hypothetical protein